MHSGTQKLVSSTRLVAVPHTCLWIAFNDPSKSRQLQWKRHKELTLYMHISRTLQNSALLRAEYLSHFLIFIK